MVQYSADPDVIVIGAGAAGIGAGRALKQLGVPFIILEAKDRVGGRAHSDTASLGHLWDHGCHWFHSADVNVLREMADRLGHKYLPRPRRPYANTFMDGSWSCRPLRDDYVWENLAKVVEVGHSGRDIAAAEVIDPNHPWNPMVRHWLALMYSADAEDISTLDAGRYRDTGVNLPVEDGYGALVAKLARDLPIKLNTPVSAVSITRNGVEIITSEGTITAKSAILAVPARMLETGRIAFNPGLPPALEQAFHDVPMGWYEKIALSFDRDVFEGFDPSYADIFDPVAPTTQPFNFELHPFGRPIAVTHLAGKDVRELERKGDADMTAFALEALERAFGSDIRKRVVKSATTHWSSDPYINGAYACAKPGRAESRKQFLEPLHDRVFLAGEHVHQSFNATAHGAYLSGIDAAQAAAGKAGHGSRTADPLWLAA
ncbi:MAG: FAD-dependent oxidoreductase [Rhizobiales bacterium]|nr:FAD-dependent oxidoreductase [Hyphomicrobiales bacterium]